MSTLDWRDLAARHDDAPETDDARWSAALAAFDTDPHEHAAGIDADPLLMFRDLPQVEVSRSDIDAMKTAVAAMRRAKAVEHEPRGASAPMSGRRASWPVAALFAVAVSSLAIIGLGRFEPDGVAPMPTATLAVAAVDSAVLAPAPLTELQLAVANLPLVEETDPIHDLLMQIEDDEISLVVVASNHGASLFAADPLATEPYDPDAAEDPFDGPLDSPLDYGA